MDELNSQLGELGHPFPSKILEKEHNEAEINFRGIQKAPSTEGGIGSTVFYIGTPDADRAIKFFEKVEREDTESNLRHRHPTEKILAYLGIVGLLIVVPYEFYKFLSNGIHS